MHPNFISNPIMPNFLQNDVKKAERGVKIVAVASGKGGVGKTWISVSIALLLASFGKRVLLFDADFGLANIDIQMGVIPHLNIFDYFFGNRTLKDIIQTVSIDLGVGKEDLKVDILAGRSGDSSMTCLTEKDMIPIILDIRNNFEYDIVIIDLCASINDMTRHITSISDLFLAVTTEEPTALADVYATMKLYIKDCRNFFGHKGKCKVLINQAGSHRSGVRTFRKLNQACGTFLSWSPELAGVVRKDTRVLASICRQKSLMTDFPTSPSWIDVTRVARNIL